MPIAPWKEFIHRYNAGDVTGGELHQWQQDALREVLAHVKRGSAFYRQRLVDVEPRTVTLESLSALPYTTKSDLAEAMYDLVCGDIRDSLYYFSTTGTTGRASPCPRSAVDFEIDNAPITASLGNVLGDWLPPENKPVLAMICPNETHSVCLSISAAAKELGVFKLDAFPLSPVVGFERLFELLLELRVNVVICSPGLLMALAEMSGAYGIDVKEDLNIQCALTTGELCTPKMAKLIEETYGARCCNWWYGSQEAGTSALAGPDGVLEPVSPNHILEVIDLETGQTRLGEGYGELCLTTLIPGMKPLIRYRTGDLVVMARDGSGRSMMSVLGRIKDRVTIGGRARAAADIEEAILGDHGLIYGYQLEVREESCRDAVLVKVKPKEFADPTEVECAVAAGVERSFGVPCRVEVVPLLDLVTATGGWVSWKTARIVDRRATSPDCIESQSASQLAQVALERI